MSSKWLTDLKNRKWKSSLAIAISTGLMTGCVYSPSAFAADYTNQITGNEKDSSWLNNGNTVTTDSNGKVIYNFKGDNSITVTNKDAISLGANSKVEINTNGGTLNLKNTNTKPNAYDNTSGLSITDKSNVTINGNLNIQAHADYSTTGISVSKSGTGDGAETHLTINGDVTMRKADGSWGITSNNIHGNYGPGGAVEDQAPDYTGARWAPSGIRLNMGDGSTIDINGNVDLAVKGNAVVTDPFTASNVIKDDYKLSTINLNGGNIKIETPEDKAKKEAYYALANFGGTINVNMNKDNTAANNHDVTIKGNIISMKNDNGSGDPYYYRSGQINLGLSTENSSWTGVIDNSGTNQAGEVNLYLSNKATWNHQTMSKTNGLDNINMPEPSVEHYGKYDGISHVNKFTGGATPDHAGVILQNDKAKIDIKNYSGNTVVIYDHQNDGSSASDYTAGDIIINSAAVNSGIVLSTSNKNIDMANNTQINNVLNALAGKLTYTAYTHGEKNLNGKVQIASGLTASSQSLKLGSIAFDEHSGKGSYANDILVGQTKTEFTTAITGNKDTDKEYVDFGVLQKDGTYKFTQPQTSITTGSNLIAGGAWLPNISAAVSGAKDKNTVLDLQNNKLDINTTSNTHTTGVTAIGNGTVEINNAGKMNIHAESTGAGQTAAVFVNAGGKVHIHNGGENLQDKVLVVRADSTNKANAAVIKSMNGVNGVTSSIVIDGLVDVVADGDMSDGKGANEAVSAVASTIEIGGGSIKAINGAAYAIRAYGEFQSQNTGIVNVNVKKDEKGNVIGAGTNKTTIEGDIATTGGMGNKGLVSVGLSTNASSWKGNYTTAEGGKVNLFMSNGANWTGNSQGAMDVDMTTSATWNGYSTSDKFNLNLGTDAIWHNTNKTDKVSKINNFNGNKGFIDMTNAGNSNVNINNYSGNTTIIYAHENDGTKATDYKAGDTIINKAQAGSEITLSTDNKGITMTDSTQVGNVLNALAGKLTYTAYTQGETNLSGKVQIASGLTSSSAAMITGDIVFDKNTGKGTNVNGGQFVDPPEHQTNINFATTITGDKQKDLEYVFNGVRKDDGKYIFEKDSNINITSNKTTPAVDAQVDNLTIDAVGSKLNINTSATGIKNETKENTNITAKDINIKVNSESRAEGIHVLSADKDKKATTTINGNVNANVKGSGYAIGAYVAGNAELTINGNVTMRGEDGSYGLNDNGTGYSYYGSSALYAGSNYVIQKGGTINVNGNVDLYANGSGIFANGGGSTINVDGGTVEINKDRDGQYALIAQSGFINMNMNDKLDGADTHKVNIKGNIGVLNGSAHSNEPEKDSIINLGLSTKDSTFNGVVENNFSEDNIKDGFMGQVNMYVSNGATWTNEVYSELVPGWGAKEFTGSVVDKFVGGTDKAHAGYILQKDTNDLTIKDYSGNTVIAYEHQNDGSDLKDYTAGNTIINHANKDSYIKLVTDNKGIDMKDDTAIEKTLSALAQKLQYTEHADGNLQSEVGIASGLTSSSAGIKVGDIIFDDKGIGQYETGSMRDEINYNTGDYESYMMLGTRSAMMTSMLSWRDTASDMFFRTGQLRDGEQDGIWARTYGGKTEYDGNNVNIKNSYWAGQLGYDKTLADGWSAGVAFDYQDGSADYLLGGTGDNSLYALGFYATKEYDDNSYLDLSAKVGKVKNDFKVYNEIGQRLDGDYSANAYSLSAQYGKRFTQKDGSYIEPQAELTWSRVNGQDYDAHSGKEVMNIHQEAFDSMVGRIGVKAGKEMTNSNIYAMISLAHEFSGDIETSYFAKDGGLKSTTYDLGDTWSELTLGGSVNLSEYSTLYADVTTGLTGDFKHDWEANVGVKFLF